MLLCKNIACLFSLCLLCAGCYESKYPLSSADASRIDGRLLKHWVEEQQSPGEKRYRASIFKFSEKEYLVAFSRDNETATIARAFTTMIGAVSVLNLQGIESQDPANRTYVFFKYGVTPDGLLQTWMISRDSPLLKDKAFSSQRDFATYIKKNIHDKRLFGDMRIFKPVDGMDIKLFP